MSTLSILPAHYDLDFIIKSANVLNHFGYEAKDDGIHFRYQLDDYDAVQAAIASYPVDYMTVMAPMLINFVSRKREQEAASFKFNGITVPLDAVTIGNLTAAVVGLERNEDVAGVDWSLGKGVFIQLTRDIVFAMADAAFRYIQACFSAQRTIVEQIKAAADIEELRLIDIANHEAWPH
jgi:hypothetical protein